MEFPVSFIEYCKYWNAIRGDSILPSREDFNPFELVKYLPRFMVVEQKKEETSFYIRLIGTELFERFGIEFTGSDFSVYLEYLRGKDRLEQIEIEFISLIDNPCGLVGCREWIYDNKTYGNYFINLPILTKNNRAKQFMSIVEFDNDVELYVKHNKGDFGTLKYLYAIDLGQGVADAVSHLEKISINDMITADILSISSNIQKAAPYI